MDRGQVPTTALEAALGVLLIATVLTTFALGPPAADAAAVQLEAYAEDAATILSNEPPRHADRTRLGEVVASEERFDREKGALRRRVDRILPDNVLFRVETEYGSVGHPLPDGVPTGTATVPTTAGDVTLRVWYA